ncbi:MAG: cytochrome-c peroxidase, partial [Mameliella sp.]|nr:cytochrome-c peroxidase [Phaeodactylibacter sp.]
MILLLLLISCQEDNRFIINQQDFISALPQEVAYPADNPYTLEKENLGRLLYWDPILSGTNDVACVSCHHPDLGYADGLDFSKGVGGTGLGPN